MKKSSLLLLLIVPTTCSSFKPYVFTNAYLLPETTLNSIGYDDLNWSYALFNQYASGLDYKFRINYSNGLSDFDRNRSIVYQDLATGQNFFTNWTTITSTYAEGTLNSTWRNYLNNTFFDRDFDNTTKLAFLDKRIIFRKTGNSNNTSLEIILESKISYNVNIGSFYQSFFTNGNQNITSLEQFISFYNSNNILLNEFRVENNPTGTFLSADRLYNFSSVITNVNKFNIKLVWVDLPPYVVVADNYFVWKEFNLFTQNQELSIPTDPTGNLFGFEFVAVEWWNFLGHAQNFLWWIINKSPISPVFVWIDTYIITWFEGFFNFMEELFNL